jgi:hypothetical protein
MKNKTKKYAIQLSPELADGLRYLADKSYKTQIGILNEILMPMIQIAATYKSFGFWTFQSGNTITIQFHGAKNLVSGEVTNFNDLDDEVKCTILADEINKKVLVR